MSSGDKTASALPEFQLVSFTEMLEAAQVTSCVRSPRPSQLRKMSSNTSPQGEPQSLSSRIYEMCSQKKEETGLASQGAVSHSLKRHEIHTAKQPDPILSSRFATSS